MTAIMVEGLTRTYKTSVGLFRRTSKEIVALHELNLSVEQGELFGLLGPNGAGKTTLTKILTTVLLPTAGCAAVMGCDIVRDVQKVRTQIGIVFGGERGLYNRLSARDNLQYFADLYQVAGPLARQRIPALLELVGLAERADERVEGYSRGMRQRLHIARGLINDPQVLFLDEPTIGLDPVGARDLRQIIENLSQIGKTVFLTSHYMFEIEALCDRVAVIDRGRLLMIDTPAALKQLVIDLEMVEIECGSVTDEALAALRCQEGVESVEVNIRDQVYELLIRAHSAAARVQSFLEVLKGIPVYKVLTRQPTLEDAYIKLMSQTTQDPPR